MVTACSAKSRTNMKKFIIAILASCLCLCSCHKKLEYETTLVYRIYYSPEHVVEKSFTFDSTNKPKYWLSSNRGSNRLTLTDGPMDKYVPFCENTTAPIEVVSFTWRKKDE